MMKTGWWSVNFELTLDGEEVFWDDLDEATQEHITECVRNGYQCGEIVVETDDEEEDETDEMEDCDGECVGCDRACADRVPEI